MRTLIALTFLLITATARGQVPARPPSVETQTVKVRKGMLLQLATLTALDPSTAKPGDEVPLVLTRDFVADGAALLRTGEELHATVTKVTKAGARCKHGEIRWKLERITLHDGTTVKTKVLYKTAQAMSRLPSEARVEPTPGVRAGQTIETVLAAPLIAVGLTELAITAPFNRGACSKYTKDFPLPVNATVAVAIREDHQVRY